MLLSATTRSSHQLISAFQEGAIGSADNFSPRRLVPSLAGLDTSTDMRPAGVGLRGAYAFGLKSPARRYLARYRVNHIYSAPDRRRSAEKFTC